LYKLNIENFAKNIFKYFVKWNLRNFFQKKLTRKVWPYFLSEIFSTHLAPHVLFCIQFKRQKLHLIKNKGIIGAVKTEVYCYRPNNLFCEYQFI